MDPLTVKQVIAAAIAAERVAETLFRRLQASCAEIAPEMAAFWGRMAEDEAGHAAWITGLRARLSRDELDQAVDDETSRLVHRAAQFSLEQAWSSVHDLEDAYRLADQLEHAETNAIFRFLVRHLEPDPKMQRFLDEQLEKHVGALSQWLPEAYREEAARRAVRLD